MQYVVHVPVCDLRREPSSHSNQIKDPLQESQLLYGERLLVKEMRGDWAFIEALEQKKYMREGCWKGYPGWVKASQITPVQEFPDYNLVVQLPWVQFDRLNLSFGTHLKGIQKNENIWTIVLADQSLHEISAHAVSEIISHNRLSLANRLAILHQGLNFLGSPYLWGGRSAFNRESNFITSMDCSGLTNLLYRVQGFEIPRDAHDQRRQCQEIEFEVLQPADFIFTADIESSERVGHVMLYKEGDTLLEASLDTGCTRFITGKEKLGKPLSEIKSGEHIGKFIVWFGSIL